MAEVNTGISPTEITSKTSSSGQLLWRLLTLGASLVFICSLFLGMSSGLQERLYQLKNMVAKPNAVIHLNTLEDTSCDLTTSTSQTSTSDELLLDELIFDEMPIDELPSDKVTPTEQSIPETIYKQETAAPCLSINQTISQPASNASLHTDILEEVLHSLQASSIWLSGQQKNMLALLIAISLIAATLKNKHLSLGSNKAQRARLLLEALVSCIVIRGLAEYLLSLWHRGSDIEQALPYVILFLGFCGNLIALIKSYPQAEKFRYSNIKQARKWLVSTIISMPLYCWMILVPSLLSPERTPTQLALLIGNLFELPQIYLQIALYIWVGLLLQHSKLIHRVMASLLKLPLNNLVFILCIVALMAFPTALTGASGILILAFGAVIYQTLSQRTMRKQLTLGITALTGSTGVVLTPSLLVVAIAFMNRDVTTSELFHWGGMVFLMTLFVLFVVLLVISKLIPDITPISENTPLHKNELHNKQSLQAPSLIVYGLFIALILFVIYATLGMSFNEFSAPYLLTLVVIAVLTFEGFYASKSNNTKTTNVVSHLKSSITESLPHSGAILLIMLGSFTLANTSFEPSSTDMAWLNELSGFSQLMLLVSILVIIGMIIEPFGALALVTMTLAPLAYQQGLHPIHFWMIAIVAFELGYVTPPVAMNHLLAQQQLPEAALAQAKNEAVELSHNKPSFQAFYLKHERLIVPISVLAITLMCVTFLPLFFLNSAF